MNKTDIEFLKENFKKCLVFRNFPVSTRDWVLKNWQECLFLNGKGQWATVKESFPIFATAKGSLMENHVYSLPPDYQEKDNDSLQTANKNGEWIEFSINEKGFFTIKKEDENLKTQDYECCVNEKIFFHWADWAYFLNRCLDLDLNYRAFGGWKFDDSNSWSMVPVVEYESGFYNQDGRYSRKNIGPAIPKKIRFWREEKISNQTTNNSNNKKMTKDEIRIFLLNNLKNKIHYSELPESVRSWIQSWPNIKDCYKWNGSLWMSCNDTDFFSEIDPLSIFCLFDNNLKMEAR